MPIGRTGARHRLEGTTCDAGSFPVSDFEGPAENDVAHRDIVAIGTSAGGIEALRFLAGELMPEFPASVLVTIHLAAQFRSMLDAILTQSGG